MSNGFAEHVTRFPASDPSKAEKFYSGASPSGLNIDSQGNVWITSRLGNGLSGRLHLADFDVHGKFGGVVPAMDYLTTTMSTQQGGTDNSGSVNLLRPDGTPYPGSPFTGGGLPGPWAVVVDGNDNVWISSVVIFYGMAKPVRAPQIGPAQAPKESCARAISGPSPGH